MAKTKTPEWPKTLYVRHGIGELPGVPCAEFLGDRNHEKLASSLPDDPVAIGVYRLTRVASLRHSITLDREPPYSPVRKQDAG